MYRYFVICFSAWVLLHSVNGQQLCQVNEIYKGCGGCDQICNHERIFCTLGCNRPGCYCQDGYVRSFEGGICIPKSLCLSQCPVNEIYLTCGGCDQTCNEEPVACAQDCMNSGCYCQNGYVREYEGGSCIPTYQCQGPICPVNEVYSECGGCDQICNEEPIFCTQDCSYPGCYCQNGYVREYEGGSCIPKTSCYQCRPDEVFEDCGVGQQCENYCGRGANACAFCQPGCYCQDGYIRAGPSNRTTCVQLRQCSSARKCLANEVYSTCGTACPDSCDRRNRVCTRNCVPGCFCKKGYIRQHDDTQTTRYNCIPTQQCPIP